MIDIEKTITAVLNTLNLTNHHNQRKIHIKEIGNRPYVGVHFRNSDYQSDLTETIKKTVCCGFGSKTYIGHLMTLKA